MEITREQFDEVGPFYVDSLQFENDDQDIMFEVFKLLPEHLQYMALEWTCNDTVFRDDTLEYLIENQYGISYEEFCDQKLYNIKGHYDFEKLRNAK